MISDSKLAMKLESLQHILREMESVLIAYSGGMDSTFLLKVAGTVLGNKVMAATARSETYPFHELKEAEENAKLLNIKHVIIDTNELDNEAFVANPPERCYYCKKELFSKLRELAKEYKMKYIADGSNYDDLNDYRPGMEAACELGVKSPLKETMFTKEEIRILSKEFNLPSWNKPSSTCLSSRFPYGNRITREELKKIAQAEEFISGFGVNRIRVRSHGSIARIEIPKENIPILLENGTSMKIVAKLKDLGYTYVTLDLEGYRQGAMNEVI